MNRPFRFQNFFWIALVLSFIIFSAAGLNSYTLVHEAEQRLQSSFGQQERLRTISRTTTLLQRADSFYWRWKSEGTGQALERISGPLESIRSEVEKKPEFQNVAVLTGNLLQVASRPDSVRAVNSEYEKTLEQMSVHLNDIEVDSWYHFVSSYETVMRGFVEERKGLVLLYSASAFLLLLVLILILRYQRVQSLFERQESELAMRSRLVALGEMASGIAHELNTPLAVILGYAEQIERIGESEPLSRQVLMYLDKIKSTTFRADRVIQNMRRLARDGSEDVVETISIVDLLKLATEVSVGRFRAAGIDLLVNDPGNFMVECRSSQVGQVLINLLSNAFDSVQKSEIKRVEVNVTSQEKFFEISVADSGPGVPERLVNKIFQPFFTTKGAGQGTGIGLSISAQFIAGHGGDLYLKRVGAGATFVVRLPYRQPAVEQKAGGSNPKS